MSETLSWLSLLMHLINFAILAACVFVAVLVVKLLIRKLKQQ